MMECAGRAVRVPKSSAALVGIWVAGFCFWVLLAFRLEGLAQPTQRLHDGDERRVADTSAGETPVSDGAGHESGTSQVPTGSGTGDAKGHGSTLAGCIDINTAGEEVLVGLPGIGPVLAERIVEYRAVNGPFTSVEAIVGVKGIGPAKLEKLRARVCF